VQQVVPLGNVVAEENNGQQCSEGCQCINCSNVTVAAADSNSELTEIALEEVTVTEEAQQDTEALMDWVFGPEMEESDCEEDSSSV